jgi:hypothetical protein
MFAAPSSPALKRAREIRITRAIGEVKKAILQGLRPRRAHPPRGDVRRLTDG